MGRVRPVVMYITVLEGGAVDPPVVVADRIWVAALPTKLPTPDNQTLIYPVPPPTISISIPVQHCFTRTRS